MPNNTNNASGHSIDAARYVNIFDQAFMSSPPPQRAPAPPTPTEHTGRALSNIQNIIQIENSETPIRIVTQCEFCGYVFDINPEDMVVVEHYCEECDDTHGKINYIPICPECDHEIDIKFLKW
jgi:hypothetical protein